MTQPPRNQPPGTGGGYPSEPPHPGAAYPPPGQVPPGQVPAGPVPPGHVEPQRLPPTYPPGQEPIPPRHPRRRSPLMAPLVALVGLIVVAAGSLWAMSFLDATIGDAAGSEPSPTPVVTAEPTASEEPGASESPDTGKTAEPTAEPTAVVTAPPIMAPPSDQRADVKGTILFTRLGDIWAASGRTLDQMTNSDSVKSDSSPAWTPDGKHIYFIRSTKKTTDKTRPGGKYTLNPTDLMRMKADGSDRKMIFDALIKDSRGLWFSHVVQPSVNPSGGTVAVVSDGPDGSNEEVTLHVINTRTGTLRKVATPTEPKLGHNDPAFSPDGTKIAFTYNDNSGTEGLPKIAIHTCQTKANCSLGKVKYLKPGYANPSWSPDSKLLAVEATSGTGRDIAIITARRGDVRVVLTQDGDSFAPVFSPDGDQIAYLHRDGLNIDLRVMTLDIDDRGRISKIDDRPVTSDGGVDGGSAPSWFIPADQLTNTTPQPGPSLAVDASDEPLPTEEPAAASADPSGEAPPPPPPPGA